jgi:DNA-binding NarL/FixJ family response regulator
MMLKRPLRLRVNTVNGNPDQKEISVFIIDDHAGIRTSVGRLIHRTPGLVLCGEASTAEDALTQIPACHPQVVLVDLSLPGMDGVALIGLLHKSRPDILTLAISGYLEISYSSRALRAGARGYLMKDELIEVGEAIHYIVKGGIHISKRIRDRLDNPPSPREQR